jgi:hypothetical protein
MAVEVVEKNLFRGVKKKLVSKLDKVRIKSVTITQQEQKT